MAESAAAEKSANAGWWKALTVRKKPKEVAAAGQDAEHAPPSRPFPAAGSRENQHPNSVSDGGGNETGGYERGGGGFVDKGGRRNLKISRSGRFKEKRKLRTALPENPKFFEANAGAAAEDRQ